jgi:hypothetical protein
MSDTQNDSTWWLGTDGKWYPPVAAAPATGETGQSTAIGDALQPPVLLTPPSGGESSGTSRNRLVGGLAAAVAALVVGSVLLGLGPISRSNPEVDYVKALNDAGLNEWATDRAALNAGYQVCEELDAGAPAQGSERDALMVEFLCADYLTAFKILAEAEISGTFTVRSSDFSASSTGRTCRPSGGYGDINSSTQVVVTNGEGQRLARSSLGSGRETGLRGCEFSFTVTLTEGEDDYVVEVGRRGQVSYSWSEITTPGRLALVLGD